MCIFVTLTSTYFFIQICFSGSLFRGHYDCTTIYVPNIALLKFLFCLPLKFARLADFFHSTQTNIKVGSRKSIGKDPKLVCCATQNFSGGHPRTMSTTIRRCGLVQSNLDLRYSIFPFLNRELFDLRKNYVLNLKTGCTKKMPYVGEFAS